MTAGTAPMIGPMKGMISKTPAIRPSTAGKRTPSSIKLDCHHDKDKHAKQQLPAEIGAQDVVHDAESG